MYQLSYPLILGSSSPRRQDLLRQLGLDFKVATPLFEEAQRLGETAPEYVLRNAKGKNASLTENSEGHAVLTADTVVVLGEDILEKPRDRDEAIRMLTRLQGKTHTVYTGFCVRSPVAETSRVVRTDVTLAPLGQEFITCYVDTGEPMDKAGAYAAQGIGASFVASISGSYTNVVGLPLREVVEALPMIGS